MVENADISPAEGRDAARALRAIGDRYQALVAASAQIVWTTPPDGLIDDMPLWRTYTGQTPEAVRGWGWLDAIHPDDRPHAADAWSGALAARSLYVTEYRIRRHDGAYRRFLVRGVPVMEADGTIREWVGFCADITERTQAEERQRFLDEIGVLLASSLDYEVTLGRVVRLCIPALADWCTLDLADESGTVRRLAFAHRDPAAEEALAEMGRRYPPAAAAPSPVHDVLSTGRALVYPTLGPEQVRRLVRDEEHLRLVGLVGLSGAMVLPLQARGRVFGTLSLTVSGGRRYTPDDQKLAEEVAYRAALALDNASLYREAQDAIRLREQFASIASHELKTPLTGAHGYADLLERQFARPAPDRERVGRYLGRLREGLNRLSALVDDLLDIARLQEGRLAPRPTLCDLAEVARAALDRFIDAPERSPAHELVLDAGPLVGYWDPAQLDRALTNLVSNALKYSPHGGEVRIALRATPSDDAILTVRDRGIGIPPEVQPTLFQPFVRGTAALSDVGGTGLGLYIVSQVVRLHGGTIDLTSAPGDGTTITVRLPRHFLATAPSPPRAGGA